MRTMNTHLKSIKKQVRVYVKKKKITAGKLADLAGVKRWSVARFLKEPEAGITLDTWLSVSDYMMRNP